MAMYPATYRATVYNEASAEIENVQGFLFAESFAKAAETVEKYYGNELASVSLFLMEETGAPLIELPEEILERLEKE